MTRYRLRQHTHRITGHVTYRIQMRVLWLFWLTVDDGFLTAEDAQAMIDHFARVGR